jgi:hypothetical protein
MLGSSVPFFKQYLLEVLQFQYFRFEFNYIVVNSIPQSYMIVNTSGEFIFYYNGFFVMAVIVCHPFTL